MKKESTSFLDFQASLDGNLELMMKEANESLRKNNEWLSKTKEELNGIKKELGEIKQMLKDTRD